MNTFTTFSNASFASQVQLVVGKIYRVPFAGEKVRAKFLGAKDQEMIVHEGKGRRVRVMKPVLYWERI